MSEKPSFFAELQRRNVVRMAGLYLVGAWLLTQVASTVLPMFGAPEWLPRSVVVLLAIGFIPALIFSWVFELTPEGLKRDEDVPPEKSIAPQTGRRMDLMIIAVLVLALGYFAFDKFALAPRREAALVAKNTKSQSTVSPNDSNTNAKSIAVLPFENLSSDKENAYFAEGMQDEILTRLAKIGALKVISRSSTRQYESKPGNLREIGQQLGVNNILEGSVQRIGDAVHVNAQLIRALTDDHLWAESYDCKLSEGVFAVEMEVAQKVASALNATLTGAEKQVLTQKPTNNPAAYDAYLRGKAQYWQVSDASQKAALHSFEEAVQLDPQFAGAWAALSQAQSRAFFGDEMTSSRRAAAEKALAEATRLQPDLAETQLARAYFQYWVLRDYKGALEMMRQLRTTWPNNAELLQAMAFISARLGQWQEALNYIQQSVSLNPNEIYTRLQATHLALAMRDFPAVLEMVDNALQIWPNDTNLIGTKAFVFQARGQLDEARTVLNRLPSQAPEFDRGAVALFYQAWLRRDPSLAINLFESEARGPGSNDPSFLLYWATLLDMAGRKAEASAAFIRARDRFQTIVNEQPQNASAMGPLVVALAATGQRDDALKMLDRFDAACGDDARARGTGEELKARIFARLGDKERSIASLERLLSAPSDPIYGPPVTPVLLRLDPDFVPLHGDPRFEKLCQEKQK